MTTQKLARFTFADMENSLAAAMVGDYIRVSVDRCTNPTRYKVVGEDGDTIYIEGAKGTERSLIIAKAEQTVWLTTSGGNRRVVQAWVEGETKASDSPGTIEPAELQRLRHDRETMLVYAKALQDIWRALDLPSDPSMKCDDEDPRADAMDTATQACARIQAKHELDKAHAALGRELARVERDRDECRVALGQIRNVAHGVAPGTSMLPSNSPASGVVIDVTAALYRESAGSTHRPISVPPELVYRGGLAWALPGRMQSEPLRPEPRSVKVVDGVTT